MNKLKPSNSSGQMLEQAFSNPGDSCGFDNGTKDSLTLSSPLTAEEGVRSPAVCPYFYPRAWSPELLASRVFPLSIWRQNQ